ncbi:MAG: Tetratricopeptide 2 repeat protein [Fibrobacteres bacterium]|nr:Tetratricopeptide 2 repeat protein [Fibrobacterota bacterium]
MILGMDTMGAALWDLYENQKVKGLITPMRQTLSKLEKSGQADHRWFNAMGELAVHDKNHSVAARFFRQAMDEKPMPEYELNLGNALFYAGDFQGAKTRLGAYLQKYPGDVHGLIDLANCHLKLLELDKVKDLCNAGLGQKAAKAPLWNCLGQVSFLEGNHGQAWDYFDKAYAEAPEYTDALFNRGNTAYRLGRIEEALRDFSLCVRKDENYEAALLNMAIVRLERGDFAEGKVNVGRVLKLNPDNVEARHVLGRLCLAGKEFRGARDAFHDTLKYDENHVPTLLALAKLHIQEAEQEEAGAVLKRLLAKKSMSPEETLATLTLMMEMGENVRCVQYLQALDDRALDPPLRKILVLGLWKTGKTKDAIRQLESVLSSEGETAGTLTLLGRMLVQSGAEPLAESRYQKALEMDPAAQGAAFELARIFMGRNEGQKAITVLERLLLSLPGDPDCFYNLACCHARNRNFDDSLHYLKQALENGFQDIDKINADEDLTYIRQLKEYNQLAGETGLI